MQSVNHLNLCMCRIHLLHSIYLIILFLRFFFVVYTQLHTHRRAFNLYNSFDLRIWKLRIFFCFVLKKYHRDSGTANKQTGIFHECNTCLKCLFSPRSSAPFHWGSPLIHSKRSTTVFTKALTLMMMILTIFANARHSRCRWYIWEYCNEKNIEENERIYKKKSIFQRKYALVKVIFICIIYTFVKTIRWINGIFCFIFVSIFTGHGYGVANILWFIIWTRK